MNLICNMEKNQRAAYYIIGALLIVGAILDFSKIFAMLLGLVLIVEAYLGWCGVPFLLNKINKAKTNGSTPPPTA